MGFTSGAKVLGDIIDEIADSLIASSVNWVEGDSTWDTDDRTTGNDNARRCLKYTGDTEDIWLTLEAINSNSRKVHDTYYAKGLRVSFSSGWDSVNNTWSGTPFQSFVAFESEYNDTTPNSNLETLQVNYFLWTDSSGFVIMGVPEPIEADNRQSSFIAVVEHMGTKEYSDGLTNFYFYQELNYRASSTADSGGFEIFYVLRPFSYEDYNDGVQFWSDPKFALKSNGNGKVYFMKPIVCNTSDEKTPIYQSELFFKVSTGAGLVDGDVIAIDGETTKYLVKMISSPDSGTTINYAMKYVA
ncbi:MAG: hypothetical protein RBT65_00645 [Methanolobus sp.]|jgi:hypothetical protein|nr:hypothetical protein [Methanolobus sp.]